MLLGLPLWILGWLTPAGTPPTPPPPRHLVELFTSEGCSSCPPADAVLGQLAQTDPSVLALSFHVDYWDYIGWRDPFGLPQATARQQAYGRRFGLTSIYTPQAVVAGRHELVGSNGARLAQLVRSLPAPTASLRAAQVTAAGGTLTVAYTLAAEARYQASVALVQRSASVAVKRGENTGRTLSHRNVVRSWVEGQPLSGSARLVLPTGLPASEVFVALWLTDPATGQVVAAWPLEVTP